MQENYGWDYLGFESSILFPSESKESFVNSLFTATFGCIF